MNQGFLIKNVNDVDFELQLFGAIDSYWSVNNVVAFSYFLNENKGKKGKLMIHSEGGEVIEAIGIANLIKAHGKIDTVGIGLVASAATVVLLAGRKSSMYEDAYFMIHNPSAVAAGGSEDLRKVANLMDSMTDDIANIYLKQVQKKYDNKTLEEIKNLMALETWFTAQDAFEYGFIDKIESTKSTQLPIDAKILNTYKKVPTHFLEKQQDMSFTELFTKIQDLVTKNEPKMDASEATQAADVATITVESASAFLKENGYDVIETQQVDALSENLEQLQQEISNKDAEITTLKAEVERLKANFKTAKPSATTVTDNATGQKSAVGSQIANFFKNYKR